jgi:hypothetical protein
MAWRTINGKRRYIPENPEQHEARERKHLRKLESDINRLRNPNTAMNPYAIAFAIKESQREIKELKKINGMKP